MNNNSSIIIKNNRYINITFNNDNNNNNNNIFIYNSSLINDNNNKINNEILFWKVFRNKYLFFIIFSKFIKKRDYSELKSFEHILEYYRNAKYIIKDKVRRNLYLNNPFEYSIFNIIELIKSDGCGSGKENEDFYRLVFRYINNQDRENEQETEDEYLKNKYKIYFEIIKQHNLVAFKQFIIEYEFDRNKIKRIFENLVNNGFILNNYFDSYRGIKMYNYLQANNYLPDLFSINNNNHNKNYNINSTGNNIFNNLYNTNIIRINNFHPRLKFETPLQDIDIIIDPFIINFKLKKFIKLFQLSKSIFSLNEIINNNIQNNRNRIIKSLIELSNIQFDQLFSPKQQYATIRNLMNEDGLLGLSDFGKRIIKYLLTVIYFCFNRNQQDEENALNQVRDIIRIEDSKSTDEATKLNNFSQNSTNISTLNIKYKLKDQKKIIKRLVRILKLNSYTTTNLHDYKSIQNFNHNLFLKSVFSTNKITLIQRIIELNPKIIHENSSYGIPSFDLILGTIKSKELLDYYFLYYRELLFKKGNDNFKYISDFQILDYYEHYMKCKFNYNLKIHRITKSTSQNRDIDIRIIANVFYRALSDNFNYSNDPLNSSWPLYDFEIGALESYFSVDSKLAKSDYYQDILYSLITSSNLNFKQIDISKLIFPVTVSDQIWMVKNNRELNNWKPKFGKYIFQDHQEDNFNILTLPVYNVPIRILKWIFNNITIDHLIKTIQETFFSNRFNNNNNNNRRISISKNNYCVNNNYNSTNNNSYNDKININKTIINNSNQYISTQYEITLTQLLVSIILIGRIQDALKILNQFPLLLNDIKLITFDGELFYCSSKDLKVFLDYLTQIYKNNIQNNNGSFNNKYILEIIIHILEISAIKSFNEIFNNFLSSNLSLFNEIPIEYVEIFRDQAFLYDNFELGDHLTINFGLDEFVNPYCYKSSIFKINNK